MFTAWQCILGAELYPVAIYPDYQNHGIGTGGDEGHAPARASYEKAGYTGLPLVRYYQALD